MKGGRRCWNIYTVREAEEKDIPALCALMQHLTGRPLTREEMADRLQFVRTSPFDSLYVCKDENGAVVGAMGFRIRENIEEVSRYGEISVLVVDPRARRKGIGRILMEKAEQLAAQTGCKGTWLVSGFGREEEAHRFYKALGYEVTGYRFVKKA